MVVCRCLPAFFACGAREAMSATPFEQRTSKHTNACACTWLHSGYVGVLAFSLLGIISVAMTRSFQLLTPPHVLTLPTHPPSPQSKPFAKQPTLYTLSQAEASTMAQAAWTKKYNQPRRLSISTDIHPSHISTRNSATAHDAARATLAQVNTQDSRTQEMDNLIKKTELVEGM